MESGVAIVSAEDDVITEIASSGSQSVVTPMGTNTNDSSIWHLAGNKKPKPRNTENHSEWTKTDIFVAFGGGNRMGECEVALRIMTVELTFVHDWTFQWNGGTYGLAQLNADPHCFIYFGTYFETLPISLFTFVVGLASILAGVVGMVAWLAARPTRPNQTQQPTPL
jgi:hypothetical protein